MASCKLIFLLSGDFWTFEMGGKFTRDLPQHSKVNITGRINGTEEGLPGLEVVVDFCQLADSVEQNDGDLICPPKKGMAVIRREEYIPWGYPAVSHSSAAMKANTNQSANIHFYH